MILGSTPAAALGTPVQGAGSTWVQIALDQWRADIAKQGYSVNYQGVGSSAGRSFYIQGQVDFAASEIPFQPDEVKQLNSVGKHWQYLPDVAGGTSLMYNLHAPDGSRIGCIPDQHGATNCPHLQLDADAAGKIFTGGITRWQDPEIQALNPGLTIKETRIQPVIRSDGSGTSAQFSLFLADQAPSVWNAFAQANGCPAPCSQWPQFGSAYSASGSDSVANFVSNDSLGSGAIGYVEAGYAYGRGFPVGSLHNASGGFTQPVSANIATALRHATLNADLTQNLTASYRAPEPTAYAMSSYSYMITPTMQSSGFDPGKGLVLGTWIIYIACAGQREAAPLGYSPLPPNLIQADFDAVNRIPGHPVTPPLDYAHCPNPTLVSDYGGGPRAPTNAPRSGGTVQTASGPAATAAAAPTAAESIKLGPGQVLVQLLNAAQRSAILARALDIARRAVPPASTPLFLSALALLLLVFVPILSDVGRGKSGRG
ncbi:MAG TPA: substrate-binding domain-containing protein [Candidatus Solibacter sp.]|jgi:phosphate transport system substrate-binding protein|nr:substrate-binding domain-containing protein [Candidatus Solibacter sp.]